jgi:hypothetical protein
MIEALRNPMAVTAIAAGFAAGAAPEVAQAREGVSGNSIVCDGVQTKAELIRLAKGGADDCGNKDIDEAWARFGITPELAKTAKSGTVCGNEGMTSQGRRHSPNTSLDKRVDLGRTNIYERPLAVWGGKVCYSAWVMTREDGRKVAVIKDCGNGEGKPVKKHVPQHKVLKAPVKLVKHAKDSEGKLMAPTPTGLFKFNIECKQNGKKLDRTLLYMRTNQILAKCDVGKPVSVEEYDTPKWLIEGNREQTQIVRKKGNRFVFVNRQESNPVQPVVICSGDTNNTSTNNSGNNVEQGNCSTSVIVEEQPPEQPKNTAPHVEIRPLEHLIEGGEAVVCGSATDGDAGDKIERVDIVKNQGDPISIGSVYQPDAQGSPDKYCAPVTAGQVEQDTDVTVTMIASDGELSSDKTDAKAFTKFPVVNRDEF